MWRDVKGLPKKVCSAGCVALQVGVVFIPHSNWEGTGSVGQAVSMTHARFTGPSCSSSVQTCRSHLTDQ